MIITIVTPVLNGGLYFRECIESVKGAATSQIAVEHLIIDGGSTDGSVELAEAAGLRVLKEHSIGLTGRMNIGNRAAKGGLIGFLGADDVLLPGAAEAVVEAYRRSGRRWLVGGLRWIGPSGQSLGNFRAAPHWMTWRIHAACDFTPISPLAAYMSQEFFLEYGGYDERYEVAPEFDLFARALRRERFERIDRPLACWRRHGQNNSVVHRDGLLREGHAVRESFGMRDDFTRSLLSYAMKAWFHLSNPGWCAGKMSERVRLRLGMAQVAYYR
jgi:glycosyltransferase involved in cell wall biosynthesis